MNGPFVLALIGALGGTVSLMLRSILKSFFFPGATFAVEFVVDFISFSVLGFCILYTVRLYVAAFGDTVPMYLIVIGSIFAAASLGLLFSLGTIGYLLSLVIIATVMSLVVSGISIATLRHIAISLVCSFLGWTGATLIIIALSISNPSLLNVEPLAAWIPFGIVCYCFTVGLLFSVGKAY